jgi:Flp pilus assembly protein CpaB
MLVTPEDAEKLIHAANKGQIQLGLRNTLDLDSVETRGVQVTDLLPQIQRAAPVRTVPTTRRTNQGIEIWRGAEETTETVEGGF